MFYNQEYQLCLKNHYLIKSGLGHCLILKKELYYFRYFTPVNSGLFLSITRCLEGIISRFGSGNTVRILDCNFCSFQCSHFSFKKAAAVSGILGHILSSSIEKAEHCLWLLRDTSNQPSPYFYPYVLSDSSEIKSGISS